VKYKLYLVGVQEVRWEGGGTDPEGVYTFFYGKGNENHELGTDGKTYNQIDHIPIDKRRHSSVLWKI
jgi:hypothetical protein